MNEQNQEMRERVEERLSADKGKQEVDIMDAGAMQQLREELEQKGVGAKSLDALMDPQGTGDRTEALKVLGRLKSALDQRENVRAVRDSINEIRAMMDNSELPDQDRELLQGIIDDLVDRLLDEQEAMTAAKKQIAQLTKAQKLTWSSRFGMQLPNHRRI